MSEDLDANIPSSAPEVAASGRPIPQLSNASIVAALRQITDRLADLRADVDELQNRLNGLSGDKAENYLALADAIKDIDERVRVQREDFDKAVQ
jgi:septal ring factor EnvC (AmiA/AmiB activator)